MKAQIKAKMKDDLIKRYEEAFPGEIQAYEKVDKEDHKNFISFLESIQDKEVVLVFTAGDAFEKNDNNYLLPNQLWDEINQGEK